MIDLDILTVETTDLDVLSSETTNLETMGPMQIVYQADYNLLDNKPRIEGVELMGDKTFEELNLESITNSELEAILIL